MPLTVTFDLEDNRHSPSQEARFVAMSHRFLDYDADPEEPFFVPPSAGWLMSRIRHALRGATLARLYGAIAAARGPRRTLGEIAEELARRELPLRPAS